MDASLRSAPSLKRQLLLWLLLPQLVLWLAGGVLAGRIALSYAEKGIDQSLTQSVRSLARQVKPVGSGLLIDFPRAAQDIMEEDPDDKVSYMVSSPPGSFVLGNNKLPPPPADARRDHGARDPLIYHAEIEGRSMRVAALELDYGDAQSPQRLRVQVAKSLAVQQRIARELVLDMLVPLLLLGAVLSLLVYAGVSRGLLPLKRLQAQLQTKGVGAGTLSPIALEQAPHEVLTLAGAVNQLLEAVRRSVSQEKRFLNDAAHQLRTPLAGLKSQTELAQHETDPAALQQRLAKVYAGAERSAHLVHQLLQLARSEADIQLRPVDCAALARDLAREVAPRALAADVDFGYEGQDDPSSLVVRGEQLLLREALANLLDNALRYAPVPGRPCQITLSARREVDFGDPAGQPAGRAVAVLEVQDNGPGLDEGARSHVFERFWRGSDLPGGCGLGLAIVKEIAERHGGVARVLPNVPQGLRVQLVLPLAESGG